MFTYIYIYIIPVAQLNDQYSRIRDRDTIDLRDGSVRPGLSNNYNYNNRPWRRGMLKNTRIHQSATTQLGKHVEVKTIVEIYKVYKIYKNH